MCFERIIAKLERRLKEVETYVEIAFNLGYEQCNKGLAKKLTDADKMEIIQYGEELVGGMHNRSN